MKVPGKISSITELHGVLKLKRPIHPLISVFGFSEISAEQGTLLSAVVTGFYVIALKKDCASGKCRYGQQYYDFDEGVMYFMAPGQVLRFEDILLSEVKGFILAVHPDFLHGYPISGRIKGYGYFSYSSNEALYLSEREEKSVMDIVGNISNEIEANMDAFTQDLLISNIELLLKYCDRFYNRQFLTQKKSNNDLLSRFEILLDRFFNDDELSVGGAPTVLKIASELNLSPNYLSDMLRVQTGQTTQQHIQARIIEKAKELLSTTGLSVSEIAYQLGFEHAQSFHRLFKFRTSVSPSEFRESFN
ncbi:helix-turn-helix transcriptional regulator [Pedobacter sp.]|jgi:AraC family transcriptional activator of pobA|uniref:helix-turn-helix domain-containing protein n=1 Tax=Pedobacter sp. TaxID=1411316 RepID=UPI002BF945F7|nr:helix-turn-helix transcriptional regulator [Pedobacter sp.]HWW43302.1 helix-turn-helix transcriptional regulator [Pedobacter sp.]